MSNKPLPQEVTDLKDKIAAGLSIEDGKIKVDANTYVQTLPSTVSVEVLKALKEHDSFFYPAATLAAGELALQVMKKDKKVDDVAASFPLYGKDRFDLTFERERKFPNPQGGEPTIVHGNVKANLVTQAARASRGIMNHAREALQADFAAALAK